MGPQVQELRVKLCSDRSTDILLRNTAIAAGSSCRGGLALAWGGCQHPALGPRLATERWGARCRSPALSGLGPHPEDGLGSGSARAGAAPPSCEAPALEGVVWVDWRGPGGAGGAGGAEAETREAQAPLTALCVGQQRHLLGRYLCNGDHSRLLVTLQLPQACGNSTVAQEGPPSAPGLLAHAFPPTQPKHPPPLQDHKPWQVGPLPWNRESSRSELMRLGPL